MILLELFLNGYTSTILSSTSIIELITGLYPREQLAYVQKVNNLPDTGGFADALIGVIK